MEIFFEKLVLQLCLWILKAVNILEEIFKTLCGITDVEYNGESVNLIELLTINNSTLETVFWSIFIIAIGLGAIFTIVALIRNMLTAQKNVSSIIAKFALSIIGTMLMLAVVIVGILIADSVLVLLNNILNVNNTTSLHMIILDACTSKYIGTHSIDSFADLDSLSTDSILGGYSTVLSVWPKSWKGNGIVDPDSFSYIFCFITCLMIGWYMIKASIQLARRVFEIAVLYLTLPLSMSTLSLDDGARFKIWRETFISKIVMAFGAVLGINIFFLVIPICNNISVTGLSDAGNSILKLILIIGGGGVILGTMNMMQALFGRADGGGFSGGAVGMGIHSTLMVVGSAWRMARGVTGRVVGRGSSNGYHAASQAEYGTGLRGMSNKYIGTSAAQRQMYKDAWQQSHDEKAGGGGYRKGTSDYREQRFGGLNNPKYTSNKSSGSSGGSGSSGSSDSES